jgi:hypothetical protein
MPVIQTKPKTSVNAARPGRIYAQRLDSGPAAVQSTGRRQLVQVDYCRIAERFGDPFGEAVAAYRDGQPMRLTPSALRCT